MKDSGHTWFPKTKRKFPQVRVCDKCKMIEPARIVNMCAFAHLNIKIGNVWYAESDIESALILRLNLREMLPKLITELERANKQCISQ